MATSTENRALEFARKCEEAGRLVRRIVIEGKRIEVEFEGEAAPASPDHVNWK